VSPPNIREKEQEMSKPQIPPGYRENAKGQLIPESQVRQSDLVIDEFVTKTAAEWLQMQAQMRQFKERIFDGFKGVLVVLDEKYKVKKGKHSGRKGNVQLAAYNGSFKLQMCVADTITLGPELQAAQALIDECKQSWSKDTDSAVLKAITQAFATDTNGRVSTKKALELRRYEFPDPRWKRAMQAISDAIMVTGSKEYVRLYQRNERGGYDACTLDIASL
jgi:hypothetical protein